MTEWKERHYKMVEDAEEMFRTNTQGKEISIDDILNNQDIIQRMKDELEKRIFIQDNKLVELNGYQRQENRIAIDIIKSFLEKKK